VGRTSTWMLLLCAMSCKPSPQGYDVVDVEVDDTDEEDTDGDREGPIDDAPLFDADHLVEVDISLDAGDWGSLRGQSRDLFDVLLGDCMAAPFPSPFTYFEATATVDGEVIDGIGLRKKGMFGSLSTDKPSLKIKTDWFVDDQFLENGTERLTLNNNVQDPSMINQCIGYSVFAAAGLPAPRCNFAAVTVNGENLGVYTHIEALKKDFLERHFTDPDGDLYEGAMSDFYPGWTGTFDPKTDDTDVDMQIVHEITAILELPDDELLDALGDLVDLPRLYRFMAVEALIGHLDGFGFNQNNYAIYRDPGTGLVTFIPWGADTLFADAETTEAVFVKAWLAQRLWDVPEARDAYVEAMEGVLANAWNEEGLLAEIDRMEALISPHVHDPNAVAVGMDGARAFIEARRAVVESQLAFLDGMPVQERRPASICYEDLGEIIVRFDTLYDTLESDPYAYDGALTGESIPVNLLVGSTAGSDGVGGVIVSTVGQTQDGEALYRVSATLRSGLGVGTHWLDFGSTGLSRVDADLPGDPGEQLGIVIGSVTLTEIGENPGDAVVGTIEGTVLGGL